MELSVVLCTYNRAATLSKTLDSLLAQRVPEAVSWEIVVVDNNSKDATRNVVEEYKRRQPSIVRYLFESRQGISYARNTGVLAAGGEVVAFIDDDERADANWLWNLTSNLRTEMWAGAGGPVIPEWDRPIPRWWTSESPFTVGPLAVFNADSNREELSVPPFGANMAFRKDILEKYGLFRTDLGRSGAKLLGNEDTELGRRLFAAGERLRFEPSAITYHPVEPARLRRSYFLKWWFSKGRCDIREVGVQTQGMLILGVPLRVFRDAAIEAVRWVFATNPSQRFICRLKIWAYAGQGFESYCQTRDARRRNIPPTTPQPEKARCDAN
jgi:glucosyl-dolichyl phosphate glucuronosyltransferase